MHFGRWAVPVLAPHPRSFPHKGGRTKPVLAPSLRLRRGRGRGMGGLYSPESASHVLEPVMHFQPLSPSPFPRKQGKGSDLPLLASGEGPQGGVNAPHMVLRASRCAERMEFITRANPRTPRS